MTFEDFVRGHGLIVDGLVPDRWVAVPTEDHPRKKNGRYKWLGDVGWAQNWATMEKPQMWRGPDSTVDPRRIAQAADTRQQEADRAAKKAGWILHQAELHTHPYLCRKGFPDERCAVWNDLLVIPMRRDGRLVGAQLIDQEGGKRFLAGQATKGAAFVFDAKGPPIFCEGFATGLSIRAAMQALKIRYTIHVCFSAGNIESVAAKVSGGIVVADADPNGVGVRAACKTGKPYWVSDAIGEDFNDHHARVGLFQAALSLKRALFDKSVTADGT